MELFHFDIETVGQFKDYNEFKTNDKRGSELFYKKFQKMKWSDSMDIETAYLNNSTIISTYGKICCISFGYNDNGNIKVMSFYGDDERYIVESFNNILKKIEKKNFKLSGFRIQYFDIPWILHKLHKYDIEPASIISPYNKKPWEMRMVDMSDDWKQRFAWQFSFDEMAYELGIPSPKEVLSGDKVHETYWSGDIELVKDYCEMDVKTSILCADKIYK